MPHQSLAEEMGEDETQATCTLLRLFTWTGGTTGNEKELKPGTKR